MAKNTLFNFINTYFRELTLPDVTKIEVKQNQKGSYFYHLDLLNKPFLFINNSQRYQLINHHISVYETEKADNPTLSQYHYTAYFHDEAGKMYQLHVYFDHNDQRTMPPIFCAQDENTKTFSPVKADQLEGQFIDLAISNVEMIMRELRAQLARKISSLEDSYNALENQAAALADNLGDDPQAYIQALNKVQRKAALLTPLVRHQQYEHISRFVSELVKKMSGIKKEKAKISHDIQNSTSDSLAPSRGNNRALAHRNMLFRKPNKTEKTVSPTNYAKELQELATRFAQLGTLSRIEQTITLTDLNSRLCGLALELELESNSQPTSLAVLKNLKTLHDEVHLTGKALLNTLLKENEFGLAKNLRAFHYLLNLQHFTQALRERNHELLDFILENCDLALNNQPLTIRGILYPSAVHYCFSKDSGATPMVDCLSVLIKYGASVIVRGENGPALVHPLFSSTNHPLMPALAANRKQTIDSITFYKILIADLKRYIHERNLNEVQSLEFIQMIQFYELEIKKLLTLKELPTPLQEKILNSVDQIKEDSNDLNGFLNALQFDSEIITLGKQVDLETKEYLKKSKDRRIQQSQSITHYVDNITTLSKHIDLKAIDYETFKKHMIEYLHDCLTMIRKQSELYDVQKKLQGTHYTRGSQIPNWLKDLENTQSTLISELQTFQRKYSKLTAGKSSGLLPLYHNLQNSLTDIKNALTAMKESLSKLSLIFSSLPAVVPTESIKVERIASDDTGPVVR
ncbi:MULTISPECIES: hypothetical protein [Legionella]|uniref:Coiled-coil-containing protein n=1 Tax=Legionella maceachernii TaxID=466 RepID=A0A0W0WCV3_9GAMM|nr:hypothetical protein [Legionella maceachernii]KTD30183.1 coiled-coil-containing protein [Legionella maceachernii]SJZ92763.1 hypothetical protein SAMN02745128_01471 [Legionella maceachernii]SUP03499.1 Uncharacterised protein [Legionella maceachernii]